MRAEPVRGSPGGDRGARHAGGRVARHALHGHRLWRGAVLAHRVGALRLLPAGGGIGPARSRRQAASDSRRRAAPRRVGAIAPADSQRAVGRSGGAGRALSAPRDGGCARLAAACPRRCRCAVASFSLQGPERDKVQLLIHTDIGTDYPTPKVVSVGYVISDPTGKQIETKAFDVRASPVMNGVPSRAADNAGASLPPGDLQPEAGGRRRRSSRQHRARDSRGVAERRRRSRSAS